MAAAWRGRGRDYGSRGEWGILSEDEQLIILITENIILKILFAASAKLDSHLSYYVHGLLYVIEAGRAAECEACSSGGLDPTSAL